MDGGDQPYAASNGACGTLVDGAVYCVSNGGVVRGVPAPVTP
jgi:hypothetical protein